MSMWSGISMWSHFSSNMKIKKIMTINPYEFNTGTVTGAMVQDCLEYPYN